MLKSKRKEKEKREEKKKHDNGGISKRHQIHLEKFPMAKVGKI